MKIPPFNPSDLKTIITLHKEGKFPAGTKIQQIRKLCLQRKFPAVKIDCEWHTTEDAIRAYIWSHANRAFKAITS